MTTATEALVCNVCRQRTLVMEVNEPAEGRALFRCPCGQSISSIYGQWGQTILPSLYPSPLPPKMRGEYADYWAEQERMWSAVYLAAGELDQKQYDARLEAVAAERERWLAEPEDDPDRHVEVDLPPLFERYLLGMKVAASRFKKRMWKP